MRPKCTSGFEPITGSTCTLAQQLSFFLRKQQRRLDVTGCSSKGSCCSATGIAEFQFI